MGDGSRSRGKWFPEASLISRTGDLYRNHAKTPALTPEMGLPHRACRRRNLAPCLRRGWQVSGIVSNPGRGGIIVAKWTTKPNGKKRSHVFPSNQIKRSLTGSGIEKGRGADAGPPKRRPQTSVVSKKG